MEVSPPPLPRARLPHLGAPPPRWLVVAAVAAGFGALLLSVLGWRSLIRREVAQQRIILARLAATMAAPAAARDAGETGLENRFIWALGVVAAERRTSASNLERKVATFGDRFWGDLENTAYDRALGAMAHRRLHTALEEALTAARATEAAPLQRRAALMLAGQLQASDFPPERAGEAAEKLFREALATCNREIEPLPWAEAQGYLAEALRLRRQNGEARRLAEEALAVREKMAGNKDPSLQRWLLGRGLSSAGSMERFEWFMRVIALQNTGGVLSRRELQRITQDAGRSLVYVGQFENAEVFLREAIAQGETTGPAGALDLARALTDLGHACARLHRPAEGEPLLLRGLALTEATAGPQHPEMVHPLLGLGVLKLDQGDWAAAERYSSQALDLAQRIPTIDSGHFVAGACTILAEVMNRSDRPQEAEIWRRRELAAVEAQSGPDSLQAAVVLNKTASLLRQQSRLTEAARLMRRAATIEDKLLPADDPKRGVILGHLGLVVAEAGQLEEGETLLLRSVAFFARQAEPDRVAFATTLQSLGHVYKLQARKDEAMAQYRRSLTTIAEEQAKRAEPMPEARVIVEGFATAIADDLGLERAEALARAENLLQKAVTAYRDAGKK